MLSSLRAASVRCPNAKNEGTIIVEQLIEREIACFNTANEAFHRISNRFGRCGKGEEVGG